MNSPVPYGGLMEFQRSSKNQAATPGLHFVTPPIHIAATYILWDTGTNIQKHVSSTHTVITTSGIDQYAHERRFGWIAKIWRGGVGQKVVQGEWCSP